jgi:hypothetical protein
MNLKSLLAAVAVVILPSLALAAPGDTEAKVDWTIGAAAQAPARSVAAQPVATQPVTSRESTANVSQKEMQVVAEAGKAKSERNAFKQTETPGSNKSGGTGSTGSQNRFLQSAQMKVVAEAAKAKAAKNAGGKPSEQPGSHSGGLGSGSAPASSPGMKVIASSMKVKAEKNASGKPSEQPRSQRQTFRASARSFGMGGRASGFGGRMSGVEARSPMGRGSPGERTGSHCNARGMCF